MAGADLGRGFEEADIHKRLVTARVSHERPADVAEAVPEELAADGIVAWFQGRGDYRARALGHRSLAAHPGHARTIERRHDVKSREQFRPVTGGPMVDDRCDALAIKPFPVRRRVRC